MRAAAAPRQPYMEIWLFFFLSVTASSHGMSKKVTLKPLHSDFESAWYSAGGHLRHQRRAHAAKRGASMEPLIIPPRTGPCPPSTSSPSGLRPWQRKILLANNIAERRRHDR
jgi:hypothetical protein